MREAIGRYRITGRLGEGGMGLVYEAWDDRLGRQVAVKMIHSELQDLQARERFWREARAAGGLSHPNICHIYEIGEDAGDLFIAMERLDGESLADRLKRGPLTPQEAAQVALSALSALETVHAKGFLHRDLKPSNVFLTPHGVKLLDFGLALPVSTTESPSTGVTAPFVTLPGTVLGTPGYMSPEQIMGKPVDARADLYALGAMVFEMLSGKPPFTGGTPGEILARVLSERPAALGGSPAVVALDRVVQRALARNADDRYRDAAEMAQELRNALRFVDSGAMAPAQPIRRLIVLPFRLLRPDTELDFLAFGLADAISASLAGAETLVVRSSLAAARYAGAVPDLSILAAETDVDLVVSGTTLRAGDQIRVTAQLIEAPRGTLLWSQTMQARLTDLFQVQDDLARQVAESVNASLGGGRSASERAPRGRAHELYLRANQLGLQARTWKAARDLYEQAVSEDPAYAPAWARLGRIHRLIWKYSGDPDAVDGLDRAEAALTRALDLDPDQPMALNYYAHHLLELGRARDALVRLLDRAMHLRSDPHVFAGLVQACRYCGLIDASLAAHEHVRRLDRVLPTGVAHTYWIKGDYVRALELSKQHPSPAQAGLLLATLGRDQEAIESLRADEARGTSVETNFCSAVRLAIEGHYDEARAIASRYLNTPTFIDPEGFFYLARIFTRANDADNAMVALGRAADRGYCGLPALAIEPWFDRLRGRADFRALLDRADGIRRDAIDVFTKAGGERLLGTPLR